VRRLRSYRCGHGSRGCTGRTKRERRRIMIRGTTAAGAAVAIVIVVSVAFTSDESRSIGGQTTQNTFVPPNGSFRGGGRIGVAAAAAVARLGIPQTSGHNRNGNSETGYGAPQKKKPCSSSLAPRRQMAGNQREKIGGQGFGMFIHCLFL